MDHSTLARIQISVVGRLFPNVSRFVYALKALGRSDSFCVRALEVGKAYEYAEAKAIVGALIGQPFVNDQNKLDAIEISRPASEAG